MTTVHLGKCDGCDKTVSLAEVRGWLTVSTVVTTMAELANQEPAYHGDFCSLKCLSEWATNANTLEEMGGAG